MYDVVEYHFILTSRSKNVVNPKAAGAFKYIKNLKHLKKVAMHHRDLKTCDHWNFKKVTSSTATSLRC
jgi:hypothetical protein